MDTREARLRMLELGTEALETVQRLRDGARVNFDDRARMRAMLLTARSVLADAGYPAESVWRGLQRASMAVDTSSDHTDAVYWQDVTDEIQQGLDVLASLVLPGFGRDVDLQVID